MPGVKYTVDVEVNGGQKVESTNRAFEKTGQNVQKINQRLKSMQQELYAMAEGGDKSSKAFMDMAKRAGDLKNAMGDTRAIVNYFADGERAVNGMNNAISATTSVVQGLYGTYSLLGGEANDKLLKNMVALESMNARLSNAYNLLKPDGKAMLYMNEMAKKGNVFAGAMSKAGGFVFKMIPAFKALSIASFLGEVTGVNDKLKDWITHTSTFKSIMESINPPSITASVAEGGMAVKNEGYFTSASAAAAGRARFQAAGTEEKLGTILGNLDKFGETGERFQKFIEANEDLFDRYGGFVKVLEGGMEKRWQGESDLAKRSQIAVSYFRSLSDMMVSEFNKITSKSQSKINETAGKNAKSTNKLKSTKNTGEKLTSAAPQTFNIYIDKLNEMRDTVVGSDADLDKLGKNITEVFRRMLVQVAAEQAVS